MKIEINAFYEEIISQDRLKFKNMQQGRANYRNRTDDPFITNEMLYQLS